MIASATDGATQLPMARIPDGSIQSDGNPSSNEVSDTLKHLMVTPLAVHQVNGCDARAVCAGPCTLRTHGLPLRVRVPFLIDVPRRQFDAGVLKYMSDAHTPHRHLSQVLDQCRRPSEKAEPGRRGSEVSGVEYRVSDAIGPRSDVFVHERSHRWRRYILQAP